METLRGGRTLPSAPTPLAVGTLGAQIAHEIEGEIRSQGFRAGHLLGSEKDLTTRFGVGAAAVREATRILQARGIAQSRRGPGGGLFVTAPDREIVTGAARLYLEHAGVARRDLFEVWLALEQVAVAKLAASIGADDALHLRELLAREEAHTGARSWSELPDIHLAIAHMVGNPALELFVHVLSQLSLSLYGPSTDPRRATPWLHARHTEIVESIIAGDASLALLYLRRFIEQLKQSDDSHHDQ